MATRALAALQAVDLQEGTGFASGLSFVNEDIRTTSLRGATFVFFMNQVGRVLIGHHPPHIPQSTKTHRRICRTS